MQRTNGATGQVNRPREAQREMSFCTVLVARDPQGKMHMLRGFYWNVACQAASPPIPITRSNGRRWHKARMPRSGMSSRGRRPTRASSRC